MKSSLETSFGAALGLLVALASTAIAQPAQPGPGNKVINSSDGNSAAAPVKGRNSFTESQAKSRIEKAGFVNVSSLKKDDNGVWRGTATTGGSEAKQVKVNVDFQGNVNSEN